MLFRYRDINRPDIPFFKLDWSHVFMDGMKVRDPEDSSKANLCEFDMSRYLDVKVVSHSARCFTICEIFTSNLSIDDRGILANMYIAAKMKIIEHSNPDGDIEELDVQLMNDLEFLFLDTFERIKLFGKLRDFVKDCDDLPDQYHVIEPYLEHWSCGIHSMIIMMKLLIPIFSDISCRLPGLSEDLFDKHERDKYLMSAVRQMIDRHFSGDSAALWNYDKYGVISYIKFFNIKGFDDESDESRIVEIVDKMYNHQLIGSFGMTEIPSKFHITHRIKKYVRCFLDRYFERNKVK